MANRAKGAKGTRSMAHKVAIILSGSGVYDGSEIHEAVLVMLALQQQGATLQCFAPNIDQHHVINHLSGDVVSETRNVLIESARICRGEVKDLSDYSASDFDALIMPGGFGAAKNLCSFAFDGDLCTVNEEVGSAVRDTHGAGKPIGAMCIAPVILAKLIPGVHITLGAEGDAAKAAVSMGARHTATDHGQVIVDEVNKVATTPAYMLDATLVDIAGDAAALAKAVLSLAA